jgi:uracil phosphoribosyltransferase
MPDDIADRWVLLLDPMLGAFPLFVSFCAFLKPFLTELNTPIATGGSACKAIEVLLEQGVLEERIIFLNLIASPEGLKNVCERFTKAKVISAWVDHQLDEKKCVFLSRSS